MDSKIAFIRIISTFVLLLPINACEIKEPYISPVVSEIFSESCETTSDNSHIQVSATRAVETVNILFFLASHENWPYGRIANLVHDDILETFWRFRSHKARNLTAKFANATGGWMHPGVLASFIEYDGQFKWKAGPPAFLSEHAEVMGDTFADDYLEQLNTFYVDAHVEEFLEKHASTYATSIKSAKANTLSDESLNLQTAYYGTQARTYCMYVSLAQLSFAFAIDKPLGKTDLAMFIFGPFSNITSEESHTGFANPVTVKSVTFHEFGHALFGEFPDKLVAETSYLFKRSKGFDAAHAYATWDTVLEEHIIRAVEIRLWEALNEPATAESIRKKNSDFLYLAIVEDLLIDYENARDEYPTLTSYLPTLNEGLAAKAKDISPEK